MTRRKPRVTSTATVTPSPPPVTVTETIRWGAGHEHGDMRDWWAPEPAGQEGNNGGGEYNDVGGTSRVVAGLAHSGLSSAKLTLDGTTRGRHVGVRLFRWREPRLYREAYYEAWYYLPQALSMTQREPDWPYCILMELKSRNQSHARNDPFWLLQLKPPPFTGRRLQLYWWGHMQPSDGPHAGESGGRGYDQTVADIPIGRWFRIRWWLRQSSAGQFDGALRVWQDDTLIYDLSGIRTGYDNSVSPWGTDAQWACTLYSNGLSPLPATVYVDDARIWTVS
jgi:hypothetical protein